MTSHEPEEECVDVARARRWPPIGYEDKEHGYPRVEMKNTPYLIDPEFQKELQDQHDNEKLRHLLEGHWNREDQE